MKAGVVVFARLDSTRLPRKALLDISGRTLLGRVFDRARAVAGIPVVLATSDRPVDDPLDEAARAEGVGVFRGSVDDVACRAIACCDAFGFDVFARVCGDRPFHDPGLIEQLFAMQLRDQLDLATNAFEKSFPPGLTAEVVSVPALRRAMATSSDPEDREHVTRYFYRHPAEFRIGSLRPPAQPFPPVSLVVDTESDLARARWIASQLPAPGEAAPIADVVRLASEWHRRNPSTTLNGTSART